MRGMVEGLLNLSSAFGLSSAAGLNAYIPLLTVSIMANRGILHLAKPYDVMGQWWCVAILVVLCIVEIVVDKVPGADHINDIVQTFVRPTAGAILFASQAGGIADVHPGVWITVGLLTSGGVHTAKALARPVINVTTLGIGAPIVSTLEDLVSTVVSIIAILAPILVIVVMGLLGWLMYKAFRRFVAGRRARALLPPVTVLATAVSEESPGRGWGGGL
jgi:uncharacterized membrane protein